MYLFIPHSLDYIYRSLVDYTQVVHGQLTRVQKDEEEEEEEKEERKMPGGK